MSSQLTEGPFGFPMTDLTAREVDALLRRLPKIPEHRYRHLISTRGTDTVHSSGRWDVSWISTESIDRMGEVVLASGLDDSHFCLNPLVTLGHDYSLPPVGTSRWRQQVSESGLRGVKSKTEYPLRPDDWPADQPWLPDQVFALVRAELLRGKSIGFLPLRVHAPDASERKARGEVHLIIDEWLLLEYACVSLPANQDALVEAVAKGELLASARTALGLDVPRVVPFTAASEVERSVRRRIDEALPNLVECAVVGAVERARGRV